MRDTIFIIIFVLAHTFIIGCAGYKKSTSIIDIDEIDPVAAFAPVPSVINVPAEIGTNYLEKIVGEQLGGTIFQGDVPAMGDLASAKVTVTGSGRVRIRARDDELHSAIPLKISMRFQTLGLNHTNADAEIELRLRTKITLGDNWRATSKTTADGHTWISDPVVKVGFVTIPVKPAADRVATRYIGAAAEAVDKAISRDTSVRNLVNTLWNDLQTPVEVSVPGIGDRMWLRFDPSDIYMSQPVGRGAAITATVSVRAAAEAFAGEKPEAPAPKPLPDFKPPQSGPDSSFAINLYPEITFEQATAISRAEFAGKTFRSGLQRVKVHDIEIGGRDGLVLVRMELSGSIRGTARITGKAVYDSRQQALLIDDFELDIDTKSRYQRVRNRAARGIIESKMKPHMRFPLGEKLDGAKALMQEMLTEHKLPQGFVLNGRIETFAIRGVELTETGFRAAVLAEGYAKVGN